MQPQADAGYASDWKRPSHVVIPNTEERLLQVALARRTRSFHREWTRMHANEEGEDSRSECGSNASAKHKGKAGQVVKSAIDSALLSSVVPVYPYQQ
jgi:hypothetical protein